METSTKRTLRAELRTIRRAMPVQSRVDASAAIATAVLSLPEVMNAATLHVYLSLPDEVDTTHIISTLMELEKSVVVPFMEPDGSMTSVQLLPHEVADIVIGVRGVPAAPMRRLVPHGTWDVVLVPVVGADRHGNRLGNGAGHYDRLLSGGAMPAVALAFDCQLVEDLPVEPHDVALDVIVTESSVHRLPTGAAG